MKVGITGTREGMSQAQKEAFVLKCDELGITEFHHGDCNGADAEGHDIVREFFPHVWIVVYPPKSTYQRAFKKGDFAHPPDDYIPRDYHIVDSVDFLIGAPLTDAEVLRSGTWTTIRYARKKSKSHLVLKR